MNLLIENTTLILTLAAVFGLFMAWGIGANDVANAMGTSVGSKAITLKQAILIAMVFEFAGAWLAGGEVTSTIRKGIIDSGYYQSSPEFLVLGMTAALMSAGMWLFYATWTGRPVSTTHTIVGAIIGFSVYVAGVDSVNWTKVTGIVLSWIITPGIAGLIAFLIYKSAEKLIFNHATPIIAARRYVPIYMALAAFVMVLVTIKKGLKHVGLELNDFQGYSLAIGLAIAVGVLGRLIINKLDLDSNANQAEQHSGIERIFAVLMIVTACAMAFAHGSNDVANAIGPLSAVVSIMASNGEITKKAALAWWILPLGGIGIVIGLATLGGRVIKTIGEKITALTPSRGFAAELAAATTVVLASGTGLPISTTQTLVGALLGVGLARGAAALNWQTVRTTVIGWVATLPAAAALCIICFLILEKLFLG